jgi:phytoene desaturase
MERLGHQYDSVVIGAGLAGLAIALRLKKRGQKVLVLERNPTPGGKLAEYEWEGYRWDRGPSLFTLPEQIDELFRLFDKDPRVYFNYHKTTENCRYFFEDGQQFTFFADPEKRQAELKQHFDKDTLASIEEYIQQADEQYNGIGQLFIDRPKLKLRDFLSAEFLKETPKFMSRQLQGSLNQHNKRYLKDDKLVQLFNRFGTYNGSNAYEMSGIYSMICSLELKDGTYFPRKGMRSIVTSLHQLAIEEGIDFLFNQTNIQLSPKGSSYQCVSNENTWDVGNVVSAIDHLNFYQNILGDNKAVGKYKKQERSTSALVFYWAINKKPSEIGLHNIFFSSDYQKEFNQLFKKKQFADEPTIYVHNSSFINPDDAPNDGQNWFVMVNTPAGLQPNNEQIQSIRQHIIQRLQKQGIDIENHILHQDTWTKEDLEVESGAYLGALYGASSNGKFAPFQRHGNVSKKYRNLYFCGGTVHPGGGIPLVLKSAKIVDQLMTQNQK